MRQMEQITQMVRIEAMSDLALGVDMSDVIARLAIVDRGGELVSQGIVASNRAGAVKDAAKKAIAGAKGKVTAVVGRAADRG